MLIRLFLISFIIGSQAANAISVSLMNDEEGKISWTAPQVAPLHEGENQKQPHVYDNLRVEFCIGYGRSKPIQSCTLVLKEGSEQCVSGQLTLPPPHPFWSLFFSPPHIFITCLLDMSSPEGTKNTLTSHSKVYDPVDNGDVYSVSFKGLTFKEGDIHALNIPVLILTSPKPKKQDLLSEIIQFFDSISG